MKSPSAGSAKRGFLALALAVMVALAGCTGAAATPQTIYLTLPPAAETPTPEPTPEPTPSPEPTSTPEPTPPPSPTSSPTSPAAACTGTAEHQAYFVNAASVLKFDVYCAALPRGWWLQGSEFDQRNGGRLIVFYTNSSSDLIQLVQGRFCDDMSTCLDGFMSTIGPAAFGDRAGTLRQYSPAPPVYGVVVSPHNAPAYGIFGMNVSQASLVSIAAALVKVPKPAP
jgi:hypothetical protein